MPYERALTETVAGFANLEIFSLVLTSLGLGAAPVSHNGTSDFWTERLA